MVLARLFEQRFFPSSESQAKTMEAWRLPRWGYDLSAQARLVWFFAQRRQSLCHKGVHHVGHDETPGRLELERL